MISFQSKSSCADVADASSLLPQGGEGDADADFEDEFSDDDGQMEFDQADEAENKELEVSLKLELL